MFTIGEHHLICLHIPEAPIRCNIAHCPQMIVFVFFVYGKYDLSCSALDYDCLNRLKTSILCSTYIIVAS